MGIDQAISKVRPLAELLLSELQVLTRRPDQVATAAVELLTNPFITGETLVIDGGMSMRMV